MIDIVEGRDRSSRNADPFASGYLARRLLSHITAGAIAVLANIPARADCVQSGNAVDCSGQSVSHNAPLASVSTGGTIRVEGQASVGDTYSGILGLGDRISLSNGGLLSTTGASTDVMEIVGNGGFVVNHGSVSSEGISADALRVVGDDNSLANSGGVTTAGASARALYGEGDRNVLSNGGAIATTGAGAEGIRAKGNGNALSNEGSIATSGAFSNGARATGSGNSILNVGTIATTGNSARGIKADAGTGNRVVNRGTVRTSGSEANGIWVSSTAGQDTTIVNEASGVVISERAATLRFEDGNERFENFGRVTAGHGIAGELGGGNDYFLIGSSSRIDGVVDAGAGTDTFALGGASDASFDVSGIGSAAQYRGFERYEKVGASIWTVTGTNGAAMPWDVRDGTLMVVGSMSGADVLVHSGATLGGSGVLGRISTQPGSTLTPGVGGIGILNVSGDVLIANGTIYKIDLDSNQRSDRIVASGSATVQGGTVSVNALPGDYRPGSRWTILTAQGGVTGQFSRVTTNLAFFSPVLGKDNNNVYLVLPLTRPSVMPNDRPIIEPFFPVTHDELPQVLQLTSGEALASATGVIVSHDDLFRAAILCRLRCSTGGPPTFTVFDGIHAEYTADMPKRPEAAASPAVPVGHGGWSFWGKAIGSWGSTDATARSASIDRNTAGLVLGVDGGSGTPYRFGLAAGYFMSGFESEALSSMGKVESVHVGAYGAASFGAFNLRGGISYASHEVDALRAIAFTGFSGTNLSGNSTSSVQAFGELGYAIALDHATVIEPFVGLAHVHIAERGIIEEGSAVAVIGEAHSFDTTYSTLGARLIATLPTGVGLLTFKGLLGWRHAFGDTVPEATFSYASGSTPFLVAGAPIDRDSLVVEAGVNWMLDEKVTLGLAYAGTMGPRDREHTLRGSLSIRF